MFPCVQLYAGQRQEKLLNQTCCGNCKIEVDKVDVYYWPEPNADTSCQSIVGSELSRVDAGATSNEHGGVYWGCTSVLPYNSFISSTPTTTFTTAYLTSIASLEFKTYLNNPYDESPCGNASEASLPYKNQTTNIVSKPAALNARGHSLAAKDGVSITVLGDHTFTSPSIYLDFHGLHAGDVCGSTSIVSKMLAFLPNELSTIVGPIDKIFSSSRVFNPADLPCPPYSIASENWYKPEPGMPYRPFFAFPEKLREVVPWFEHCNAFWFNTFDPPRVLTPVDNLDPPVTTSEPQVSSQIAIPSPVQDPGATKTPSHTDPIAVWLPQPVHSGVIPQPEQTAVDLARISSTKKQASPTSGNEIQQPTLAVDGADPTIKSTPVKTAPNVHQPEDPTPATHPKQTTSLIDLDPVIGEDPAASDHKTEHYMQTHSSPHPQQTAVISNSDQTHYSDPSTRAQDPQQSISKAFKIGESQVGNLHGTTIQLGQHSSGRTTIDLASQVQAHATTKASEIIIPDPLASFILAGFGPTPGSDTQSHPKASTGVSTSAHPVVTVAGHTLTISDPSAISIVGTTITPGGAEVEIGDTTVSLGSSGNIVLGDSGSHPESSVVTIAGNIITANPTSFDIAGSPVTAGGPEITVSGVAVSLGSSGDLVIGGASGKARPTTVQPLPLFTVGSVIFTANPSGFAIEGTTLSVGGPGITVASTPVSINSQGSLLLGSSTIALQTSTPSILTSDGQTITFRQSDQVAVGGTTLSIGGPGISVSGKPISMGSNGLVIGSDTITPQNPIPTALTTDGQTYTFESSGLVALDGTTLSIGGPGTTVSGKPISVGTAGLIIGSDTVSILTSTPKDPARPTVLTTDGQTVTLQAGGGVAVGGVTLSAGGPAATVGGVYVSGGISDLVVESDRIPLPSGNGSTTSSVDAFTGRGSRTKAVSSSVFLGMLVALIAGL